MNRIEKQSKWPDPPIVPPPSEDVSTENTGPSSITITERTKIN